MKAVANKQKLEEEKPDGVWNPKKRKWTKPASQIGYKALTVRNMFTDTKDEVSKTSDFKSCVKIFGCCENLLEAGQFDVGGNDVAGKFRVLEAGAPKKFVEVRKALFKYLIDTRSTLKARLPKGLFLAKTKSLYEEYCEQQRKQGIKPEKLT